MPTPPAPWTTAMLALIDDGRWYDLDEVLTAGMTAVPPGRAIQERERIAAKNLTTGTGPRRPITDEQRIRTGARSLARMSLDQLSRSDLVEIDRDIRVVRKAQ